MSRTHATCRWAHSEPQVASTEGNRCWWAPGPSVAREEMLRGGEVALGTLFGFDQLSVHVRSKVGGTFVSLGSTVNKRRDELKGRMSNVAGAGVGQMAGRARSLEPSLQQDTIREVMGARTDPSHG